MNDPGEIALKHAVEHLLKARHRPKRQWFIERIGHFFSRRPYKRSCFGRDEPWLKLRAEPTAEAIDAIESFSTDEHLHVRIAVTHTLGKALHKYPAVVDILLRMLRDSHPLVRVCAANSLMRAVLRTDVPTPPMHEALCDDIWSVRWLAVTTLHDTEYKEQAWETLVNSIPRTDNFLWEWLDSCSFYKVQFRADSQLRSLVEERISKMEKDDFFYPRIKAEYEGLIMDEND